MYTEYKCFYVSLQSLKVPGNTLSTLLFRRERDLKEQKCPGKIKYKLGITQRLILIFILCFFIISSLNPVLIRLKTQNADVGKFAVC